MHRERRRDPLLGRKQTGQVPVDLAHQAIRAGRVDAVTVRRRWRRADKVVAFLNGKDKERVALGDAGGGEPGKELAERLVVVFQLLHIVRLARTAGGVNLTSDAVLVVCVRDVPERDRDSLLLHLRDVGEGCGCEQPVKTREARLSELVRNRLLMQVVHYGTAARDCRVYVLGSEQPEKAVVAAWLIR